PVLGMRTLPRANPGAHSNACAGWERAPARPDGDIRAARRARLDPKRAAARARRRPRTTLNGGMDAASGIGIPVAFGAGLISFLSPCVLPLVPGYISAVAGVAPGEIRARRVIGPSLAFVASFSAIFISLRLLGQRALRATLTVPTAFKVF